MALKVLACHPRSSASFPLLRTVDPERVRASLVNVDKCTLDSPACLLRPWRKNTTITSVLHCQITWLWLRRASYSNIMCNSKTPKSSPPNPITTGRQLRLSSIPKTWTVTKTESCAVTHTSQSLHQKAEPSTKWLRCLWSFFSTTTPQVPFFCRHDWTASPMTPKLSSWTPKCHSEA